MLGKFWVGGKAGERRGESYGHDVESEVEAK